MQAKARVPLVQQQQTLGKFGDQVVIKANIHEVADAQVLRTR